MKSAPQWTFVSAIVAEMSKVNWRKIAFWAALWWFIHSAPTEDPFAKFRGAPDESFAEYQSP
ncbi:MAG: hypothetical protein ACRD3C_01350 [Vicinamibacterales bacterium]